MKRTHTIIAGLILATGIGSVTLVQARGPGWGCDGMGPMGAGPMAGMQGQGSMGPMGAKGMRAGMRFDPAQRAERHLTFLKDQLKLNAEQEPLWQAFAEKAKAEAGKGFKAMREQAADTNLTAPERMAKMQKLMQERLDAMTGVHDSFNRLYGALTPEQKKIADQYPAGMGSRMGPRYGVAAPQG